MSMVCTAAMAIALATAAARADQTAPAPGRRGDGAEAWEGTFTDDNPGSAFTRFELCRRGGEVRGTVAFDGTNGRDRRAVEGAWSGGTLVLRDVQFLLYQPKPGIFLCACIKYEFHVDARGHLVGTCETNAACGDHGRMDLVRSAKIAPCSTPTVSPNTKKPPTRSGNGSG